MTYPLIPSHLDLDERGFSVVLKKGVCSPSEPLSSADAHVTKAFNKGATTWPLRFFITSVEGGSGTIYSGDLSAESWSPQQPWGARKLFVRAVDRICVEQQGEEETIISGSAFYRVQDLVEPISSSARAQ